MLVKLEKIPKVRGEHEKTMNKTTTQIWKAVPQPYGYTPENYHVPKKGTILVGNTGNTSEPTIENLQGQPLVFRGVSLQLLFLFLWLTT